MLVDPLWERIGELVLLSLEVLIPLLLDDPLWVSQNVELEAKIGRVLIPLLLDDPLWVDDEYSYTRKLKCLNPSFAG